MNTFTDKQLAEYQDHILKLTMEPSIEGKYRISEEILETKPTIVCSCFWLMGRFVKKKDVKGLFYLAKVFKGKKNNINLVDWSDHDVTFLKVTKNNPFLGDVIKKNKPVLINSSDWKRPEWAVRHRIKSYSAMPLIFNAELIGICAAFLNVVRSGEHIRKNLFLQRMSMDYWSASLYTGKQYDEIKFLKDKLEQENQYLKEEVKSAHDVSGIIGKSKPHLRVLEQVQMVAPTDTTVLILGESGTGKELVAQATHDESVRKNKPFVRVNCASIPGELFESEFFGHVKGAFTGAVTDRTGRFELAHEGTLFLDEVGEIPVSLQSKLLRAIEEGSFEKLGEDKTRSVDVRIIAATNRDLKQEIKAGNFREDLYYRLGVFPMIIPPLRERLSDIPELADHFINKACRKLGIRRPVLKKEHVNMLKKSGWPGNIRELQNVIERAVILAQGGELRFSGFDSYNYELKKTGTQESQPDFSIDGILTKKEMLKFERNNILKALKKASWRVQGRNGAAELLGFPPTTLYSRMKTLNIVKKYQ